MTRRLRALAAGSLVCLAAACAVPTGGPARTIPPPQVPPGLTSSPSAEPPATAAPDPMDDPSRVYLVAPDDSLVPRARDVGGHTVRDRLDDLLADLAGGPTSGERDEQLSTALPPDVELSVAEVDGSTVTIDISGSVQAPSGSASRRAVAQVVLTATSLPEVLAVELTREGAPVEAPLPSGELTAGPLTAADYAVFLTPATAPPS